MNMTEKHSEVRIKYSLSKPHRAYLLANGVPLCHWIKDDDKIIDLLNELAEENKELKFKLEESNSDKEYVKQVIQDRIKHYHSYSCINKTGIDNGCIGLKIELEHFYDDVEPYLEELK